MGCFPPIKTSSASTAWGTALASWLSASRTGSAAVSARIPGRGWCQGVAWPVVSIFYIFIPMIFEDLWKSTAAVVFSSLLDVFFWGTIGIIYQTYIRFGSQFGFPKICWQSLIIVWSYSSSELPVHGLHMVCCWAISRNKPQVNTPSKSIQCLSLPHNIKQ